MIILFEFKFRLFESLGSGGLAKVTAGLGETTSGEGMKGALLLEQENWADLI